LRKQLNCRAPRQWLHRLESLRGHNLIGVFFLILGLAAFGIYWGMPWLADKSAYCL